MTKKWVESNDREMDPIEKFLDNFDYKLTQKYLAFFQKYERIFVVVATTH